MALKEKKTRLLEFLRKDMNVSGMNENERKRTANGFRFKWQRRESGLSSALPDSLFMISFMRKFPCDSRHGQQAESGRDLLPEDGFYCG